MTYTDPSPWESPKAPIHLNPTIDFRTEQLRINLVQSFKPLKISKLSENYSKINIQNKLYNQFLFTQKAQISSPHLSTEIFLLKQFLKNAMHQDKKRKKAKKK